jgi:thiol-disulfide isomerase/thioredoxin
MREMADRPERLGDVARTSDELERPGAGFRREPLSLARAIFATALIGLGIIVLVWLLNRSGELSFRSISLTASGTGPAPREGEPAPDFVIEILGGSSVRLSDLRGQVVWINFWATWCPPCRKELPEIQRVASAYADAGLVVLLVDVGERASDVQAYAEKLGLSIDIGLDSRTEVAAQYRVTGLPMNFFIGKDGVMRAIRYGALDREEMEERVRPLLNEGEP